MTNTTATEKNKAQEIFAEFLREKHMSVKRFRNLKEETQDKYIEEFKVWRVKVKAEMERIEAKRAEEQKQSEAEEQNEEETTAPAEEAEQNSNEEEQKNPEEEQSEEQHVLREKSLTPTAEQTALLKCVPDNYEIMIWKCNKNMVTCYSGRRQVLEIMTGRVKRVSTNLKFKVDGMTDRHSGYGMDATVVCEEADIPKYVSAVVKKYSEAEAKKQEAEEAKQNPEEAEANKEA